MPAQFHVRLEKDSLMFSAAHFITLGDGQCESLHGHDYRVAAEVFGPLDDHQYVVDFIALEKILHGLIDPWDHQTLLPLEHPQIGVTAADDEVAVRFDDRRWTLPRRDCQLLPLANTTSELLAEYLAERLFAACQTELQIWPARVRIEIRESHGFTAACDWNG